MKSDSIDGGRAGILRSLKAAGVAVLLAAGLVSGQGVAAAEKSRDVAPEIDSPLAAYLAGLVAEGRADLQNAADYMRTALEGDPENTELLKHAFLLSAEAGDHEEAAALAKRIVEVEPDNTTANVAVFTDAVVRSDREAMETALSRLPESELGGFLSGLFDIWLVAGEGDAAKVKSRLDSFEAHRGFDLLGSVHHALMYDMTGDDEAARAAYEAALAQTERPILRLSWLAANFFARQGEQARAVELYDQFLKDSPGSVAAQELREGVAGGVRPEPLVETHVQGIAELLFNLAGMTVQERASSMALVYVQFALRLRPDFDLGHMLVAEILEDKGRYAEAIEAYETIPESSPFSSTARFNIAEQYDRLEQPDKAIEVLDRVAEARPEDYEPLFRKGNVLRMAERFEDATAAYDKAETRMDKATEEHWSFYYFRGIALERSDKWRRAEKDFQKALELEPEQPYVMNYLAYTWVDNGEHLDKATDMLNRAVELRPNDGYIVDSLGWAYYRLDQFENAVEQLERAVELRPQDPVINDHLGDAYWRVDRRMEARFQWRRALSLEPEADEIPKIERKLEKGLSDEPRDT